MYSRIFSNIFLVLVFSILVLVVSSCEFKTKNDLPTLDFEKPKANTKKDGLVKNYKENGQLLSEINYQDGKRHGIAKDYYKDGNIHNIINYQNGIKNGISKVFYENGQQYRVTPFDSGRIHGIQKKYRDSGDLMAEVPYKYGNPGSGLVEYTLKGKVKKLYPQLIAKSTVDYDTQELVLQISFDNKPSAKKAEYYLGDLEDGQFTHKDMTPILMEGGQGTIRFAIPNGQKPRETVNLVGVWKTKLGNPYVAQIRHSLSS